MKHSQPNNRPIHPECPRLDNARAECACDFLWHFWDGTEIDRLQLVERRAALEARLRGRAADDLSPVRGDTPGARVTDGFEGDDLALDSNLDGFWKDSEVLKTVRKKD